MSNSIKSSLTNFSVCAQRSNNPTSSSGTSPPLIPPRMSSCPFCDIAANYPPSTSLESDHELTSPPAFVVLSTPLCMAFLDIMPLSPGHLLVTTRKHHGKISDVGEEEARELGAWLPRLSRVLANATGVWDWNIVQNNGKVPSIKDVTLLI
jgi:diadenosine tetraphosphate (Ap4A) HIT family hydrolase